MPPFLPPVRLCPEPSSAGFSPPLVVLPPLLLLLLLEPHAAANSARPHTATSPSRLLTTFIDASSTALVEYPEPLIGRPSG